jgi:hypothetical protein
MVAIEAVLTYIFGAIPETCVDGIFDGLFPWERSMISWKPLGTH